MKDVRAEPQVHDLAEKDAQCECDGSVLVLRFSATSAVTHGRTTCYGVNSIHYIWSPGFLGVWLVVFMTRAP